jgi:hypothetical protein
MKEYINRFYGNHQENLKTEEDLGKRRNEQADVKSEQVLLPIPRSGEEERREEVSYLIVSDNVLYGRCYYLDFLGY